eukprot:m.262551 g.262551  ORF g.262551 m.262551 type:complete len:234 (-) comp11048_c0_seq6:739-1440(-)
MPAEMPAVPAPFNVAPAEAVHAALRFVKSRADEFKAVSVRGKALTRGDKLMYKTERALYYSFGQHLEDDAQVAIGIPGALAGLARALEERLGLQREFFNSVVVIRYSDGERHHIPRHSDKQQQKSGECIKGCPRRSKIEYGTPIANVVLVAEGCGARGCDLGVATRAHTFCRPPVPALREGGRRRRTAGVQPAPRARPGDRPDGHAEPGVRALRPQGEGLDRPSLLRRLPPHA